MVDAAQRLISLNGDDRRTLQAQLHRRDLPPRVRERLEMVKAADLGADLPTIAAWSGRSIAPAERLSG
jgi:hypothetical protein